MKQTIEFTRKDYNDNKCTHDEYYSQFVTTDVLEAVESAFGKAKLTAALKKDRHLNSIPLNRWDGLATILRPVIAPLMKKADDWYSLAGGVCTVKNAARQIVSSL